MDESRFKRAFFLILLLGISVLFVAMIRPFLMAILLAAIFAGLASPLYRRISRAFGGRTGLASAATILLLLLLVLVPLRALLLRETHGHVAAHEVAAVHDELVASYTRSRAQLAIDLAVPRSDEESEGSPRVLRCTRRDRLVCRCGDRQHQERQCQGHSHFGRPSFRSSRARRAISAFSTQGLRSK